MNVVVIGQKKFTGPAAWEQLTTRQFLQFMNWQLRYEGDRAGRWVLLKLWYGIKRHHVEPLTDEQRYNLVSILDFLDVRPESWLLPVLHLGLNKYTGPGDGLEYLTFAEYMHAEAARTRYQIENDPEALAELIAALYRPVSRLTTRAPRALLQRHRLDEQTKQMGQLPESVRQGILLNYLGCIDQFPGQFENLYKRTDGNGEADNGSWLEVGLSLARQTSALGSFVQLEQSNLYLVLTTLDALMKEYAALKAKLDA